MNSLFLDLKQALRKLWRSPGFTIPVVMVLALGIGANTALFAILDVVMLRPLPVHEPGRLMRVCAMPTGDPRPGGTVSYPQVCDLKGHPDIFQGVAASLGGAEVWIQSADKKESHSARFVSAGWFGILGAKPSLGRFFTAEEESRGDAVVVLSHGCWRELMASDPSAVGRGIQIDGRTATVVGIAPEGFEGLQSNGIDEVWIPLASKAFLQTGLSDFVEKRFWMCLDGVARLASGVDPKRAQAALEVMTSNMARLNPESDAGKRWILEALGKDRERLLDQLLPQRALLFSASGAALILAVVGAMGLFSARALRNRRELFLRASLGASGWALLRPLFMEALLVALMVCPASLFAGLWMASYLMTIPGVLGSKARLLPTLDARLMLLSLGLSVGALLLASLVSALAARRLDLSRALKELTEQGGSRGKGQLFVVAQVALSLLLLAASNVALNTLRKAGRTGYPLAGRAILKANASEAAPGFSDRLLERIQTLPGVRHGALGAAAPLDNMIVRFNLAREGEAAETFPAAFVGPDWFATLGVPLREGREFAKSDGGNRVILNEAMARRLFGQSLVSGRTIPGSGYEVIGVVADHRMRPDQDFHVPMLFMSMAVWSSPMTIVLVDSDGSAKGILPSLRAALSQVAPGVEPTALLTLEEHVARVTHQEQLNMNLLAMLGLGSLVLACFGLWASLNLHVALRWRELGIRSALGATARQLLSSVLKIGTRLLLLGLVSGSAALWILMRLSHWRWNGLAGLSLWDLMTAFSVMLVTGLLACLGPALRAASIDPAQALREE